MIRFRKIYERYYPFIHPTHFETEQKFKKIVAIIISHYAAIFRFAFDFVFDVRLIWQWTLATTEPFL